MTIENQRGADLGDGTYLNPILGGDYPDPSVIRVGDDYYMTHSSFNWAPGLLIWHSRDLVNWRPVASALPEYDGDVWAPDIVRHDGRWYIYYRTTGGNHVVTAPDVAGPWSAPVDLDLPHIDPGHVVGPDGRRYLHLSGGNAVELAPDGLSASGEVTKVYDGWPIPDDYRIECFGLEGPKLFSRDGWYYMVVAEGGTAGPSTSHMVAVARSRTPLGPWENSPHNPLIRTRARSERWWSRGHGTIIEAADGSWWCMYHAYENGYLTLGRQTLLEPTEWTDDGWPRVPRGVDPASPMPKPAGENAGHGMALSDGFTSKELGRQWRSWGAAGSERIDLGGDGLAIAASGTSPADAPVVACIPVDHAYEAEVDVELEGECEAGLILFYNPSCFAGIALDSRGARPLRRGRSQLRKPSGSGAGRARLRLVNDHHEIDLFVADNGGTEWRKLTKSLETSGYHHNVFGGFLSLRLGLYAAGSGRATFRSFRYRGLSE